MNAQEVIDYFGGLWATAQALDIASHATVHRWIERGIPGHRQAQIEHVTGGVFRATIQPWETPPRPKKRRRRKAA